MIIHLIMCVMECINVLSCVIMFDNCYQVNHATCVPTAVTTIVFTVGITDNV